MARVLEFAATEIVPRLARTSDELDHVLHALNGGYIPAGPSGSPLRGLINVLPTGRNFYSVDPRAVPSRLAWETGQAMAASLLDAYRADHGEWPRSVGLSVWGTSAMRTAGDDVAEVLALLGVRPEWDEASRRVTALEPIPLAELGPRIDVTVRISGFFRDAFPHVVAMLDDAVRLVAALDEPDADNHVRAHVRADTARHGDERRAARRVFGSAPGAYGAGLLPLIDSRNWRDDADLAEVYAVWGGHAYGRDLDGVPARDDMENAYRRIAVAAKNVDTREHDIADSDDYFQYHGGMIATVRALTGKAPEAYVWGQHPPGRRPHPHALGGDRADLPGPRRQPAVARRDAPKTATRARSSWPRPSTTCSATTPPPASWPTGCTTGSPPPTSWTTRTASSWSSRTRGRCTASPNGCWRPPSAACGSTPDRRSSRPPGGLPQGGRRPGGRHQPLSQLRIPGPVQVQVGRGDPLAPEAVAAVPPPEQRLRAPLRDVRWNSWPRNRSPARVSGDSATATASR